MRSWKPLLALAVLVLALVWQRQAAHAPTANIPVAGSSQIRHADTDAALPAFLPPEAARTLALIARGGPFPHRQDGVVFGNYEGLLPRQPRGYYHEYTVETPAARTRGARRIITGGTPPSECYYTADHYRSFRRFNCPP